MKQVQAVNTLAGAGAGRWRKPYVIREYLAEIGLSMADVARDLGVSGELVRQTVRGQTNNKKVLTKLCSLGVPMHALSMPPKFLDKKETL